MRYLCCFALLLAGGAHAGDLLPTLGEEDEDVQEAIDSLLLPAVQSLDERIQVQPIIESIKTSGRAKRVFFGPLAGGSHLVLRIKITDAAGVTQEVFSDNAGAWKGTFRPGQDYDMIERVVTKATEFVKNYRLIAK